jgi:hypothetical protein
MANRKFNVQNIPATYKVPNLTYVPLEEVESSNEARLYFEIFMAIGLCLMGVVMSKFNLVYFITGLISLSLAVFFIIRHVLKQKKMKESKK